MGILGTPISPSDGLDVLKEQLLGSGKHKVSAADVRAAHVRNDFPGGFSFVEIVDGKEVEDNRVRLVGTLMVHAPFEFGGEQKIEKVYYPGQSEPTMHILGPQESDIKVNGRLTDKRYKDKKFRGVAVEFQKLMDSIRIRGNLLHIQMGEISRYGFLQKSMFRMKNNDDIEYELNFAIVSFNKPRGILKAGRSSDFPVQANKDLTAAAEQFNQDFIPVINTIKKSFAEQITELIGDVASAVKLVTTFVDTVFNTIDDLQASVARAQGLVKHARNKILDYQRRVRSFPILGNSTNPSAVGIAAGYQNAKYIQDSLSRVLTLQALLAALSLQLRAITLTLPIARYRVKLGDSLQSISVRFYNTQDNWTKIYDHNKLSTTVLTVGQVLEIPRV